MTLYMKMVNHQLLQKNTKLDILKMKNKKRILLLLFITILSINAFLILNKMNYNKKDERIPVSDKLVTSASDPVTLIWNSTYFQVFGWKAEGNAIALDSLNNSYVTGFVSGDLSKSRDVCLVKYNSSGQLQWDRTWGGSYYDVGQAIQISSTDDIYIAGYTQYGFQGAEYVFLLKYNSTGDLQWSDVWDGSGICYGMAIDKNNNIFLTGYTVRWIAEGSAMFLLKYNTSGGLEWNRTWGGGYTDMATGIVVDSSNNIYLGGDIGQDSCLVKFDNSGVWQWNRSWSTAGRPWSKGITIDSSDNIYLVGDGSYLINNATLWWEKFLLKYNENGVLQWSNIWDQIIAPDIFPRLINGITLDSSNNIYLATQTTDDNLEIQKLDSSGNKKWDYAFGGTWEDSCNGIVVDTQNNIYITGKLDNEVYIGKFIENPPVSTPPEVPGYNLWTLILVVSVVSSVIVFSMSLKIKFLKKSE